MMPRIGLLALLALASPSLAADTYKIDTVHSTVLFRIKHMDVSYAYGRFNAIDGTFALDPKDPAKDAFDVTLKADSIDTGNAAREQHLKGPDLFNTKQFPTIKFKSTSVVADSKGGLNVSGDLTLHGVTKPIKATLAPTGTGKDRMGKAVAGVEGTLKIKRSDFEMTGLIGPLGDEVTVTISLEGAAK